MGHADTYMIDDTYTDTYQRTDPHAWCRGLSSRRANLKFESRKGLSRRCPVSQAPTDYYKILEVDYDATDDAIRSNYIRLALKWHPDKQKDEDSATSRFQEINEAYQVLSDPVRRREYDKKGMMHIYDYNISEYLNRYKGLILTCNGLGIRHSIL
ncbi:hypothetical protein H0E87_004524 [Populus deltoides]|uniref:J domain-containing protein n=1 Tax=Populus deltoides TaxID=3696 RepID=A0A8T2ZFQ5_POPDE|nr:hypothetical protein H0E87_004524 [Populus deltoides]